MSDDNQFPGTESTTAVSKTAVKKAMQELQLLGEKLTALGTSELKQLLQIPEVTLSESLLDAIALAKKTKPGNARRRQFQLIGKLMRSEDHVTIDFALSRLLHQSQGHQSHTEVTGWLQRLTDPQQSTAALATFFDEFPDSNRQYINQLIRNAKKENQQTPTATKHRKTLQQALTDIVGKQDRL